MEIKIPSCCLWAFRVGNLRLSSGTFSADYGKKMTWLTQPLSGKLCCGDRKKKPRQIQTTGDPGTDLDRMYPLTTLTWKLRPLWYVKTCEEYLQCGFCSQMLRKSNSRMSLLKQISLCGLNHSSSLYFSQWVTLQKELCNTPGLSPLLSVRYIIL